MPRNAARRRAAPWESGGMGGRGATIAIAAAAALCIAPQAAVPPPPPLWYLPFEPGFSVTVFLGTGEGSHGDAWNWNAIDFSPLEPGTPIVAMESGKVVFVKEDTAGPTGNWHDNNEIAIAHADGSVAVYHHLQREGAIVAVGDVVVAGDRIGHSGNTGKSTGAHLHVDRREKERTGRSLPFRFAEAREPDGVPRKGEQVTSRNRLRVGAFAELVELADDYDFCAQLDARGALSEALRKLADEKAAVRDAAALKRATERDDVADRYAEARKALLERWRKDGEASLAKVDLASAEGRVEEALLLARVAAQDFADSPLESACNERLDRLREAADVRASEKAFAQQAAFVKALAPALAADRAARRAAREADGEPSRDKRRPAKPPSATAIAKLYRAALAKGAGRKGLAPLEARAAKLEQEGR